MLKKWIFACMLIVGWTHCSSPLNSLDKRRIVVGKVLSAIVENDTLSLYKYIDTAYFFDVYGREGFKNTIKYLNVRLKECNLNNNDSLMALNDEIPQVKKYYLPYCRNSDNSINNRSFDLVFTFFDFEKHDKIQIISVENYWNKGKLEAPFVNPDGIQSQK